MSVLDVLKSEMVRVADSQKKQLAPLTDDLVLLNSGLDSLCFAILVASLEDKLGVDPFTERDDVQFPVTLGDFARFYEAAIKVA
ncbi:acyl carrier protein [Rhodoblastus sp.]|uniref:acyl carrier protein n=1 Tax=Rhodoblastus sp. TaxID=1962975 RepID=UPI0026140928|nr:acyl carrier protein [Rhodoblastus sp.]